MTTARRDAQQRLPPDSVAPEVGRIRPERSRPRATISHSGRGIIVAPSAMGKLAILNRAGNLEDLRISPGNRLEGLKRDRLGQHSVRVNDQFRVCFVWTGADAENVEIVDYH